MSNNNTGLLSEMTEELNDMRERLQYYSNIIKGPQMLSSPFSILSIEPLKIAGIALTEGEWNNVMYTIDEIKKLEGQLKDKPLIIEHGRDPVYKKKPVGKFTKDEWNPTINALLFEAVVEDPNAIKDILKKRFEAISLSNKMLYIPWDGKVKGVELESIEGSLTENPACEKAYITKAIQALSKMGYKEESLSINSIENINKEGINVEKVIYVSEKEYKGPILPIKFKPEILNEISEDKVFTRCEEIETGEEAAKKKEYQYYYKKKKEEGKGKGKECYPYKYKKVVKKQTKDGEETLTICEDTMEELNEALARITITLPDTEPKKSEEKKEEDVAKEKKDMEENAEIFMETVTWLMEALSTFPANPEKGTRVVKKNTKTGKFIVFEATGKKGFGAWKILKQFDSEEEAKKFAGEKAKEEKTEGETKDKKIIETPAGTVELQEKDEHGCKIGEEEWDEKEKKCIPINKEGDEGGEKMEIEIPEGMSEEEASAYTQFIGKCRKEGKSMKQCAAEWKKAHPAKEEKSEEKKEETELRKKRCDFCNELVEDLDKHFTECNTYKETVVLALKCKFCGRSFDTKKDLIEHLPKCRKYQKYKKAGKETKSLSEKSVGELIVEVLGKDRGKRDA